MERERYYDYKTVTVDFYFSNIFFLICLFRFCIASMKLAGNEEIPLGPDPLNLRVKFSAGGWSGPGRAGPSEEVQFHKIWGPIYIANEVFFIYFLVMEYTLSVWEDLLGMFDRTG